MNGSDIGIGVYYLIKEKITYRRQHQYQHRHRCLSIQQQKSSYLFGIGIDIDICQKLNIKTLMPRIHNTVFVRYRRFSGTKIRQNVADKSLMETKEEEEGKNETKQELQSSPYDKRSVLIVGEMIERIGSSLFRTTVSWNAPKKCRDDSASIRDI